MLSAAGATPPDQEVFRRFQRLHGLPEVGYPDWENRGKAAEADAKRLREALGEMHRLIRTRRVSLHMDGTETFAVPILSELNAIAQAALSGKQP